jgi:hypothetical protein
MEAITPSKNLYRNTKGFTGAFTSSALGPSCALQKGKSFMRDASLNPLLGLAFPHKNNVHKLMKSVKEGGREILGLSM